MNLSLYSPQQEENIYIRKQARTWQRSGLITQDQLSTIVDYTNPDVRETNVFFRLLFFIFTILCTGATLGLFIWITGIRSVIAESFILIFTGVILYILAEYAVTKYRLYRHGIEEALAASSMYLLCAGLIIGLTEFFSRGIWTHQYTIILCLFSAVGACWIYMRFGYLYAALISIIALCMIPFQLSMNPESETFLLLIILLFIFFLNVISDDPENEDFKKEKNATLQPCLMVAIYLTVQILGLTGLVIGNNNIAHIPPKLFPLYIYWLFYVLTFIIPAAGIYWGIQSRKRLILSASIVMACITLAANKSYLGWTRYAWDPAILGTALVTLSILINRWLNSGKNKARNGFTAENILIPENHGMGIAEAAAALTPLITGAHVQQQQQPAQQGNFFDGGSSGGGGVSGEL